MNIIAGPTSLQILLTCVHEDPIHNNLALVQLLASRRTISWTNDDPVYWRIIMHSSWDGTFMALRCSSVPSSVRPSDRPTDKPTDRPLPRWPTYQLTTCPSCVVRPPIVYTVTKKILFRISSFLDTRYIGTYLRTLLKPASQLNKYGHNNPCAD